jgi:TolA-binding protein
MTHLEDLGEETEGLEEIVEGVRAIDDRLDEVARARIAASLAHRLDARAVERARRATPGRRFAVTSARWLVPAACAALGAWLAVGRGSGAGVPATAGSLDRMEVPAGARVRARVGHADLTLMGPARMEVARTATSDLTLRLTAGTLVGDYDGRSGGRLRIETPRLVATIVGTRFVVEATADHARLSVAHGRVAVRDATTPEGAPETFVNAGQSWEVGRPAPVATTGATTGATLVPIPETVARLLAADGSEPATPEPGASPGQRLAGAATATLPEDRRPARSAPLRARELEPELPMPAAAESGAVAAGAAGAPQSPASGLAAQPLSDRSRQAAAGVQPPPLPPPSQPPAQPIPPAELYRRAETAMSRRDDATARRWLEEIVERYPRDPEAESARFELARDALAAHEPIRAGRWVDELIADGRDRSLVESARFLKCRLAREGGEAGEARACLERFRTEHPGSARDEEALAALIALAEARGSCDEVRLLVAEHRRLYPGIVRPEGNRARCSP